jgi:hypothetical protein
MRLSDLNKNESFYFVKGNNKKKDSSYYSLMIGIEAYLKTYNSVAISLRKFMNEDKWINEAAQENDRYIECYLNLAIHIQHFFELEIKRVLEKEHILLAVDVKGNPIITHKLLNNVELLKEETEKLKSVEFSTALERLTKLVNESLIDNQLAKLLVDNKQLLTTINYLRNTTLHRGRRIMNYCTLDRLFAEDILPLIKEIIELPYYNLYKQYFEKSGVGEVIDEIILEGKKQTLEYSSIAYLKEIGRCKFQLIYRPILDEKNDRKYIEAIIEKKVFSDFNDAKKTNKVCPCCQHKTIFVGQEFIGYDFDELGDEMGGGGGFQIIKIPDFELYHECAWCGVKVSTFVEI